MTRKYSSISVQQLLDASIGAADTTIALDNTAAVTALLGGVTLGAGNVDQFTIVIDPDTASEEIIFVRGNSGNQLTGLVRGQAGTSATTHTAGATIKHVLTSNDLDFYTAGVATANAAVPSATVTAKADLLVGLSSGVVDNLAVGTNGQVLTADSSQTLGVKWAAGIGNPLTTTGDIIYSSNGTTAARLGIGSTGQVLTVSGGIPVWAAPSSTTSQDFVLINSGGTALTGSGTTTINVSNKNQLFIKVVDATAVGPTCDLRIRFNSDSGTNYGYIQALGQNSGGTTWAGFNATTTDTAVMLGNTGNNEANTISANILVSGANATGYKPISFSSFAGGSGAYMGTGDAWYSGTSAITSVSIISNGQNFDGGTVYIYGA